MLRFAVIFSLLISNFSYAANFTAIKKDISDSLITTKITAKFAKDGILNPLNISVTTDNGTVILSGNVKSQEGFMKIIDIVNNTNGVKKIETNNLIIKNVNTNLLDAYITAKVETAILKAKVLDDSSIPLVGINTSTNNGVVVLDGKVKSLGSATILIKRIANIKGVKKVISHLKVDD